MSIKLYDIPSQYKSLYICGDIHGEFPTLVYELQRHGIEDAAIIVAGDCGIGFEQPTYYDRLYHKLQPKLEGSTILLLLMRGNHDAPEYFEKQSIDFPLMKTIPDYSVVRFQSHHILCVGGAVSVDRRWRRERMEWNRSKHHRSIPLYWENEAPVYDEEKLSGLSRIGKIDTVITHAAPSFCYPQSKDKIAEFLSMDEALGKDLADERHLMDRICDRLKSDGHPVVEWFYGHYHESHTERISGTEFSLLHINELRELQ